MRILSSLFQIPNCQGFVQKCGPVVEVILTNSGVVMFGMLISSQPYFDSVGQRIFTLNIHTRSFDVERQTIEKKTTVKTILR